MLVDAPSFTPRPYGLWSVLGGNDRSNTGDNRWRMGVTYEVWCPTAASTYDPCVAVSGVSGVGVVGNPPAKAATFSRLQRSATPFTIYDEIDCAPVGNWEQAKARAVDALTRSEMRQVEAAFATGLTGGQVTAYPHLAANIPLAQDGSTLQTAATTLSSTPVDVVEAFARLESALASCYDGVGVLHLPAAVVAIAASNFELDRRGNQLYSPGGHLIAAGAGYPGTSPAGTAPATGTVWLYATGALFGYRSDIFVHDPVAALDRSVDTVKMIAERTYLLGWDCCHFAIPVSLGGTVSGTFDSAS